MTTTYTGTYRFEKPDFRSPDWGPSLQRNFDAIDTALRAASTNITQWDNEVPFEIGMIALDVVTNPSSFWICIVNHTSAAEGAFSLDRAVNPTYWTPYSFGLRARGAWVHDTVYIINDITYDSVQGVTGICKNPHTSNHAGTILTDSANWDFIVNLPTVFTAVATSYNNASSGLIATNVQTAIDEVFDATAGAFVSSNVTYDHTISSLVSNNVKAAIDELKALIDAQALLIAANTTAITTGTLITGSIQWRPNAEALAGWVLANGKTIGKAGSGADFASATTQALFVWLYTYFSDAECPVSGGRVAGALTDFNSGKTIGTLDMRGTGIMGMDTMQGTATARLNNVPAVVGDRLTAGSILGENLHALTGVEHASHFHAVFPGIETHTHGYNGVTSMSTAVAAPGHAFEDTAVGLTSGTNSGNPSIRDQAGGAGTANQTASQGSGTAHNTVSRSRIGSFYLKL